MKRVVIKYNYGMALCNWIKGVSCDKQILDLLRTIIASNRSTLWSFSNILMKSFLGGWGISDRHDCRESSNEPKWLYGGIS